MDEMMSIEAARPVLGEIVDRARLADEWTVITRNGKPAAVVVNVDWHTAALAALKDSGYPLSKEQSALLRAYDAARKSGNPFVFDPSSLEIRESER